MVVETLVDLDLFDAKALTDGQHIRSIGVGVAQSALNGPLMGTIWLVVISSGR
ncbi:MAG: hypothetical protein JWO36_749 [Myxococcales bacterium]|nr:hypothetical protein [Myxococcales bacterium]